MIALAFMQVRYPILPVIQPADDGQNRYYQRNYRLFTPRDFDFSPYFEIIKYPLTLIDECAAYRELPWDETGIVCNGPSDCFLPVLDRGRSDVPSTAAHDSVLPSRRPTGR